MRMIWIALGVLAAALASIAPAAAQNTTGLVVSVCGSPASPFVAGRPAPFTVDTTGTLCDAGGGGGGGSAVPFTPNGNFGTLTATAASSASTAMPAGATVALQNTSTVDVSCVLSSGAATATTNKIVVRGGATVFVAVGSNINAACINQTGVASNVVVMAGGAGLGTNFGGGGGGSSGGGTSSSFDAAFPATGTAVGLSDGTNMKSWLTALIQTKTAVNGNNMGSVATWLWNGASFDAATGTAALGQYVQAKSGAYAAGALAAGAFTAGAGVDGWDLTQGAKADAACGTATGTCSVVSLLKYLNNVAGQAVPVTVNGTPTGLTGLTPGVAQTGTIVAANVDLTSKGGVAYGAMANYGTSPGAVKVDGVNAFVTNTVTTTGAGGTFPATQSGTWTVQPGNTANTTPWLTTPSAGSASGATPSFVVAANSNNSTSLKGSAGTVYSIQTSNINASTAYFIKLYDKATAPTCGTDTPVAGYVIPAANGGNNVTVAVGKKFTLGIGYCVVAGIANNDNTSVPAATVLVNVDWN